MAAWVAFGALTFVLIAVLLGLSIASARAVEPAATPERPTALERSERAAARRIDGGATRGTTAADPRIPRFEPREPAARRSIGSERAHHVSTGTLLANVAFTQGLFGVVLLAGAAYFAVPLSALGMGAPLVAADHLSIGLGAGVALWLGNELAAGLADAAGVGYDESVRSMLTPDSTAGWVVLLGLILPTVAVVEELLFRGAAIGALATGFAVPEPILVVASSVAFGAAHGAQGRLGALVATTLGLVLGGVFVLTGSLLVVVVAHYAVNALEFVVHEGLGFDRPLAFVSAFFPS